MSDLDRRQALVAGASALGFASRLTAADRRPDLIRAENEKPGTTDWQLTYVKFDPKAKYRQSLIEGYCDRTSVRAGETIDFFVSTERRRRRSTIDLYRLGYYGGNGGRHVQALGPFEVKPQPTPPVGDDAAARVPVGADRRRSKSRRTGSAASTSASSRPTKHRYQSYVIFIVPDDRPADFLFQCSTNTWQAYNKWPDDVLALRQRPHGQEAARLRRAGQLRPAVRQVPAGHSTTRCHSAPASSCCSSSRSPTGSSSRATT